MTFTLLEYKNLNWKRSSYATI